MLPYTDQPSKCSSIAYNRNAKRSTGQDRGTVSYFLNNFVWAADRCNTGKVPIDMLPEETLLEIFGFHLCADYDDKAWETLVHVCRRWRSIVFAAPRRLNLKLVCTSGTPARKMLEIWPAFPISVQVDRIIDDNVLAALKKHDRICEVYVNDVSDRLVRAMQVTFPALTDLCIHTFGDMLSFSKSFLGGSAPNLQLLNLRRIAVPALPELLLSSPGLVHLFLSEVPHSGDVSPDAMVDFLSSLARLETLHIDPLSTRSRRAQESRRPAPLKHIVFPVLRTLHLNGQMEYLEQILAHISVPPLDYVYIGFIGPTMFDISRISQWIGHREMFEAFDQVYMLFNFYHFDVMLSSLKGATGGKMLRLSLEWIDSAWKLQKLNLDSRHRFCDPFDHCEVGGRLPPIWAEDMEDAPWLDIVRFYTATEYMYLSQGVAVRVSSALQELAGTGVTEVLPVLRSIFVERLDATGPVQEAIGQFVATRQLLTGHSIDVQCWVREMESTN